jgi:hypothetical protein
MKRSILFFAALAASALLARAQAPVTQPPEPVDPSGYLDNISCNRCEPSRSSYDRRR